MRDLKRMGGPLRRGWVEPYLLCSGTRKPYKSSNHDTGVMHLGGWETTSLASVGNGNYPRCSGRISISTFHGQLGGVEILNKEPLVSRICRTILCFCDVAEDFGSAREVSLHLVRPENFRRHWRGSSEFHPTEWIPESYW